MNTDNITNGHGQTEEMNVVAQQQAEQTEKEFKKEPRKTGYVPPMYIHKKENKKDESSEGGKHETNITQGRGYVQDFDTWVNDKAKETKDYNEE